MIKLLFCLRRRPELSREEFHRYWREHHGPLVADNAATLGMRRYVQCHTFQDPVGDALRSSRGAPEPFDGVAELWWDDLDSMRASSSERRQAARTLLEDERTFLDLERSPIWLAEEHEVFRR